MHDDSFTHFDCHMRDFKWLREKPVKHGQALPDGLEKSSPVVERKELIEGFSKDSRKSVTVIAAPSGCNASVGIPFLLGKMANSDDEPFKMILAQKILISHSRTIFTKLVNASPSSGGPIKLRPHEILRGDDPSSDQGTNLHVCTYPYTLKLLEEALECIHSQTNGFQLSHLVLDCVDCENCIELEGLYLAIELAKVEANFRVIILTDGLAPYVKNRVESLCSELNSFMYIDLTKMYAEKPCGQALTFNEERKVTKRLPDDIFSPSNLNLTHVDLDSEMGLSSNTVHDISACGVRLIQYLAEMEYINNRYPSFVVAVFTPSYKISKSMKISVADLLKTWDVCYVIISKNYDLNYLSEHRDKERIIYFVTEAVEETLALKNVDYVVDLGLTHFKVRITPVGNNRMNTIWADRRTLIRRANHAKNGKLAYPFDEVQLRSILSRSINRPPGFDLDIRYFHDNKEWRRLLEDEGTESLMGRAQMMAVRTGLMFEIDGVCTPLGSFCWGVLPMLLPRLSKLILCGIVCGCVEAAVALAVVLSEDTAVIECSKHMQELRHLVTLGVESEHLAMMHAYDSRHGTMNKIFPYNLIHGMEKKEKRIWKILKGLPNVNEVALSNGRLEKDDEMESRLLLAIAMALGDRVGSCKEIEGRERSNSFQVRDPDDKKTYTFESSTFLKPNVEIIGVYYEMREREHYKSGDVIPTAEVTVLPLSIMAAIGNIGGEVQSGEKSVLLTTNCGPLHITMSEESHIEEALDMRYEVEKEVERVALAYLQYPHKYGCPTERKTERDQWMDQLIPLFTI